MTRGAPPPADPEVEGHEVPRLWRVGVIAFVALQLLLPLPCFFADRFEAPANFCWDMYSYRYSCQGSYRLTEADGEQWVINPFELFPSSHASFVTMHRRFLPSFHSWLCRDLSDRGLEGRLEGNLRCSTPGGDAAVLVSPGPDLCAAGPEAFE